MKKFIITFMLFSISLLMLLSVSLLFFINNNAQKNIIISLNELKIDEITDFANKNNLNLIIDEIYSDNYPKDTIINQSIKKNNKYKKNNDLKIDIVIGSLEDKRNDEIELYKKNNVNELGRVPIMMYHGIQDKEDSEKNYIGGNADEDGYQRTPEAFREDLEYYYQNNYRMIRLTDYVDGIIDVEIGKSPIVLTFDDGLQNNIKVMGLDDDGNIIIDPNSAVGILEEFKKKYSDYNVTATFFVSPGLFGQPKYNEKILKWLVKNGYDIGNHTVSHPDFTEIAINDIDYEIGSVYEKLEQIIPNSYVNIVALPFGSPYKKDHEAFNYILSSNYNGKKYETKSTLRAGWESDYSPFSVDFDKTFIKRIAAHDNDGKDFDIKMNFDILENNRYISDGDKNKIVIKKDDLSKLICDTNLEIVTY